jgi:hypothetical protein
VVSCDCGSPRKRVPVAELRRSEGALRSCGCLAREMLIGGKRGPRAKVAHGHARRGRKTSIYELWRDLRKRYPGQVCRRWQSFETFVRDLGARPPGWVLARLNPRRVWGPSNVGWAIPSNRGSRNRQA